MKRGPIAKLVVLLVTVGAVAGLSGSAAHAKPQSFSGSGTTTPADDGTFSVHVLSPAFTADVDGAFAPNTGTGSKATPKLATHVVSGRDASGNTIAEFAATFDVAGKMAGTVHGTMLQPTLFPDGANVSVSIKCFISYPPLKAGCTVIITL